jgi:NAD(P)-dependent dehydrogenase (short-subunit alcohol dehydrogenase family)
MRMAEKEEIASLVTFLCSNHSSYMPGSIVKIDGVGN